MKFLYGNPSMCKQVTNALYKHIRRNYIIVLILIVFMLHVTVLYCNGIVFVVTNFVADIEAFSPIKPA